MDCLKSCTPLESVELPSYTSDPKFDWCDFTPPTTFDEPTINEDPLQCESFTCGAEITPPETVDVTGVTVEPTTIDATVGDSDVTIVATVVPADATNKNVTWTTSDPDVATVDSNGKVTIVGEGTATITATTVDGGFTATTTVTVTEVIVPPELTAPIVEVGENTYDGLEVIITSTNGTSDSTFIIYDTEDDSVVVQGASPLMITGTTQGDTYPEGRFVVVEVVDDEESPSTPVPEFRTPYQIYPPTIESVTPTEDGAVVIVVSGNGIDGSTMKVYQASDDTEIASSESPVTITGLEPNTTYPEGTFYIREQTGDGLTDPVDIPEFTTLGDSGEEVIDGGD